MWFIWAAADAGISGRRRPVAFLILLKDSTSPSGDLIGIESTGQTFTIQIRKQMTFTGSAAGSYRLEKSPSCIAPPKLCSIITKTRNASGGCGTIVFSKHWLVAVCSLQTILRDWRQSSRGV